MNGEEAITQIVNDLDHTLIFGKSTWEILLYASLTPYAPPLYVNRREIRKQSHVLLCGDISVGKSPALRLLEQVHPKTTWITRTTAPSFEGIVKKGELKEGIIDEASGGLVLIPEFNVIEKDFPSLREVLDCGRVVIYKHGVRKITNVNICFVVGANPRNDFWGARDTNNSIWKRETPTTLREQLNFKQGLLSRFDATIPMMTTPERTKLLTEKIELFSQGTIDLTHHRSTLKALKVGMGAINRVEVSQEHQKQLKETFLLHNRTDTNQIPLTNLKDLETLARLVNVLTTVNFESREVKDKTVVANDEDISKATELFDTIMRMKETIQTSTERRIITIEDTIILTLLKYKELSAEELIKMICGQMKMCSRATAYRKINSLAEMGVLDTENLRNKVLKVKT